MNSGSLWCVLNVSMRTSSNSNFFSNRHVRTLATSVDAGWPNTCRPAAMLPFDFFGLQPKLWDDNEGWRMVMLTCLTTTTRYLKETRETKCLPCYLTPHKWKRRGAKAKRKVWILACDKPTIILSLPQQNKCIQNSPIYFHFCTAMKRPIYRTVAWETAQCIEGLWPYVMRIDLR